MSGAVQQYPLEEEYKKKSGITPEDVLKLRDWLDTQPHLPREHISDMDLILTYHCCNRSSEVAKQVLDLHYTLKTLFTPLFKDRLVNDKILKTMGYYVFGTPKIRAHDGSAIIYCRLFDYDPKNFIFADAVRASLMVLDLWQFEEGTWPGFVIIIDLDRVTLSHLVKLDLQTIQQLLYYLQEAMLVKITGVHFLNAPSFMDKLMMMLRPFLNKNLMDMLSIHEVGSTSIEKHVPLSALPKEAGGQSMSFEEIRDEVLAKVTSNSEFYIEENKKRVVESRRPGKPKTISEIFGGVEGSFKKLDID